MSHSLAFHPRIMPDAKWSALGVIVNLFSLFSCGVLSIIVIFVTDEPLEVVLNAMAIFFIVSLDNMIVPRVHMDRTQNNLEVCLERSIADPSLPVAVRSKGFHWPLKEARNLIYHPWTSLILSIAYLVSCKQPDPRL